VHRYLRRSDSNRSGLGTSRAEESTHKEDPFSIRANPSRDGDAKPRVRTARLRAGLPKEGLWSTPRDTVVFLKGDHVYAGPAVAPKFRLGPGCSSGCAESRKRRGPRRFLDRSHHEHRWQPADRPRVLSCLLRGLRPSVRGSVLDPVVHVQNTRGGTVTGTASVSAPFSIVSGSPFTLVGAGATQTVTVRFAPTTSVLASTNVSFSADGDTRSSLVTGTGVS